MSERRFNQAEVAAIFEWASEAQHTTQPQLAPSEGMTLSQLQDIGREVGISPLLVDQAAKVVDLAWRPTSRKFLGLPVGVGLSMDLNRKLSDAEWERLVVDLRETFDARGKLSHEGSFRQWSNGNLQANLEPTERGDRIRLRTVRGQARELIIGGLAMVGFAAVAAIAASLKGPIDDAGFVMAISTLATGGAAMAVIGGLPLRAWARLRGRQMEQIATRVAVVANTQPEQQLRG